MARRVAFRPARPQRVGTQSSGDAGNGRDHGAAHRARAHGAVSGHVGLARGVSRGPGPAPWRLSVAHGVCWAIPVQGIYRSSRGASILVGPPPSCEAARHAREAHPLSRGQLWSVMLAREGAGGLVRPPADHSALGRAAAGYGLERLDSVDTKREEPRGSAIAHLRGRRARRAPCWGR